MKIKERLDHLDELVGQAFLSIWNWSRRNFKTLIGLKVASLLFMFTWFWMGRGANNAVNGFKSIPSSYWLWAIGIVLFVTFLVLVLKNKTARGYAKKNVKIRWGRIVWPVVIVLLAFFLWKPLVDRWNEAFRSETKVAYAENKNLPRAPAEVALPYIAFCESSGRQFDSEGNLVINPESGAVGKYQIIASLHEERADSMGYDIRTLEGNEAFAEILYQESGTRPWEASRACWEPKLLAHGYREPDPNAIRLVVSREWSQPIFVERSQRVDWMPEAAVTYEVMTAHGNSVTFPAKSQAPIEVPGVSPWIRFRAVSADTVAINIVLSEGRS